MALPLRHTAIFLVGAGRCHRLGGPRTGPSHARTENGVFQPGESFASSNGLKGNPFTDLSEVEDSLCEKCGLTPLSLPFATSHAFKSAGRRIVTSPSNEVFSIASYNLLTTAWPYLTKRK